MKTYPVRTGRGDGDAASQAKHFTSFALQEIERTMTGADDEKLRFAAAKYLIEIAWGRPAPMKPVTESTPLDPQVRANIIAMLDAVGAKRQQDARPLGLNAPHAADDEDEENA